MLGNFGSHLRSQWIGTVALFLVLTGGTAWAVDGPLSGRNTVGSEDIINNEVKSVDIVADSVGGSELRDVATLATRTATNSFIGSSNETLFVDSANGVKYEGLCQQTPEGVVTASVTVKSIDTPKTLAVDSNAPNGANNVLNVPHGTVTTLVKAGPTTNMNFSSGDYGILAIRDSDMAQLGSPSGIVGVATNLGETSCRFSLTVTG